MAGANPAPIIAVKIFVEENEISPMRIALKKFRAARYAPAAVRIGRKKLRFVQHAAEDALELLAIHERKQPADAARGTLRHFDVLGHIRMIVDEPLHAALEAGKTLDDFRLESLDREKRDQSDHRPDFQKVFFAVREFQHVIKKTVGFIPK